MVVSNTTMYVLKGYGSIDPVWIKGCFNLFKEQQVNIRKLLLTKNGNPAHFSMLEIHFALFSQDDNSIQVLSDHPFLQKLQNQLSEQDWAEQSLEPLS